MKRERITTIREVIETYNLPVRFEYYDPNPNKDATFPEINNGHLVIDGSRADCSTRAICAATGEDYDTIQAKQFELAIKYKIAFNHLDIITLVLQEYSYEKVKIFKISGLTFILKNPVGKYLLCNKRHIYTVIDGCVYDNIRVGEHQVYPTVDMMFENMLLEGVDTIFRKVDNIIKGEIKDV